MSAEGDPREELLGLVRSLAERLRTDGEMGRPLSYLAPEQYSVEVTTAESSAAAEPAGGGSAALEGVRAALGDCRRCLLHQTRHRLVFGEGNPQAELVFVGEAPGADEDDQGRPFVGLAGQLLTKIIGAMGLQREEVYICNILKCRPPGNRNPQPEEIAACELLIRQLRAIQPKVICALGTFDHTLLKSEAPISVLRGRFHSYHGIPLMPTYHPAYLLGIPGQKSRSGRMSR